MKFWVIKILCFNSLICQRLASSSQQSFFITDENDILESFFGQFKRDYLTENEPRNILVVGGSTDDLRQVHTLINSYPYVACTDTKTCVFPGDLDAGSFVIIFLDDLTEETLNVKLEVLRGRRSQYTFLFVLEGDHQDNGITYFFEYRLKEELIYVELVHLDKDVVRHHSSFLTLNCTLGMESRFAWRPGSHLNSINTWAFRLRTMNGCPVTVSTIQSLPNMIIKENPNGSSTIVGGPEGQLVKAIAEKFQFTISVNHSTGSDQRRYDSKLDVLNDVVTQVADIGIAQLRATNHFTEAIGFSQPYSEACITWGIPLTITGAENLVWDEFSSEVWTMIGLMFIVSSVIQHVHHNIYSLSRNGNRRGVGFVAVVLDIFSMNLGNPIIHVSGCIGGRLILISCLFYSTVITTGYKTSLASIISSGHTSPVATDVAGILKADLHVVGSDYNLDIINDLYTDKDQASELIRRYTIINNISKAGEIMNSERNTVYFARLSTLRYIKQKAAAHHELIKFNIADECALTYPTVIAFHRSSFLQRSVDDTILYLRQSGILDYWERASYYIDEKLLDRVNDVEWSEQQMRFKIGKVFILYLCCTALCVLVFFIELLTARFKSRKIQPNIRLRREKMQTRRYPLNQD